MYIERTSKINYNQKLYLINLFTLFVSCTSCKVWGTTGTVFAIAISFESLNRFKKPKVTLIKTHVNLV